jgi:hypothetical protein
LNQRSQATTIGVARAVKNDSIDWHRNDSLKNYIQGSGNWGVLVSSKLEDTKYSFIVAISIKLNYGEYVKRQKERCHIISLCLEMTYKGGVYIKQILIFLLGTTNLTSLI